MTLNVHTGLLSATEAHTTPPLKVKRLHSDAILPTYGSDGAACFDLYACGDQGNPLRVNTSDVISTGIAVEIPKGWEMVIRPRSGLAFKDGIHAFQGTIDADYRGEIKVLLMAPNATISHIPHGTRIAQAKLQPAPHTPIIEVGDLSDTARGAGGFGSTGK